MRSIVRAPLVLVASSVLVLMGLAAVAAPPAAAASLSLDRSTPASVKKTGTTLTTATFTPPAGSVLAISAQTNGYGSNDAKSIAVSDNLTAHLAYNQVQAKGNTTNDVYAKLYWAAVTSSQPMTVTATIGGSSDYSMLSVLVFTGANTAAPIGASGGGRGATGIISDSYRSTADNSWGWLSYGDWAQRGVPAVPAAESVYDSYNVSGEDTYALIRQNNTTATAGTQVAMSTTSPTSGAQTTHIYFEVVPAAPQGPSAPVISSFTASPATITQGQSTTLSWSASGNPAPTLTIDNGIGDVTGKTSQTVTPTQTTTYTLTATNTQGTASSATTVTVGPPDTTPPAVTSTSPAAGATGVAVSSAVTATFSEPVQPATITFGLKNSQGTAIAGATSYNTSTNVATFTPNAALASSTSYTATVSGAKDLAGNTMNPVSWSFTTAAVTSACPCTIWPSTTTPGTASTADNSALEVGVRFRSDVAGYITGLHFYKGSSNTGTHIGHLWSNTGTLLASVTFSGETASGWQQATLPTPIAINANTTYVASYHTDTGYYSSNNSYFAGKGADAPPLHALADGTDGPNGVYHYGASAFPIDTYKSSNYWVDVVFDQTATDHTPPTVTAQSPAPNSTTAPADTTVTATFSEPVQPATITITLTGPAGAVAGNVSYDGPSASATFTPTNPLANSTAYTATVSGAKDQAGNTMSPISWSFTTAAPPPPPPNQGPGGPVLLVTSAGNPFSSYYAEILRAEGVNEFDTADVSSLSSAALSAHDVVILGQVPLTSAQVSLLTDFVNAGGSLIAMRPDPKLAGLLGLTSQSGTLAEGYLAVNTSVEAAAGITTATMQFHGTADEYGLGSATPVAMLYSDASRATSFPAVTLANVGANGGQVAAFTYDLARSVVLTRQGNPAWAGQERDGQAPIRSDDLFFGGIQKDWVDLSKVAIPQADEQQRLFANLVETMDRHRMPLPRLWYFPRDLRAVIVGTGDDHGNGGTAGRFDEYNANSPAGCSVTDWTCLRFTSYIYPSTPLTNAQASTYNAQGFEVGLHPTTGCADFTDTELNNDFSSQLAQWRGIFTSLPPPTTSRTHCLAWSTWLGEPTAELAHGIRLDANYYYWPPTWVQDRPGFFTGSGMPLRFTQPDGTMINVYQATTQMTDESGQSYPYTVDTLLNNALGPRGYYGAFTVNMHTDSATTFDSDEVLSSALAHHVPIVTARQMLSWLDGRNGSSFKNLTRTGNTLSFSVATAAGANGLTVDLPIRAATGSLSSLTVSGNPVSYTTETIKGLTYAVFPAGTGTYNATYAGAAASPSLEAAAIPQEAGPGPTTTAVQAPPDIRGISVEPLPDGTASITWNTDVPADTVLHWGTSPSALSFTAIGDGGSTSHWITLTDLSPGHQYFVRISSRNQRGNSESGLLSFTAPAYGVSDSTREQFVTGSASNVVTTDVSNGEIRLATGATSGSLTSRVLDADERVSWRTASWQADVPAGTSVRFYVRTGSISKPDATWSAWAIVPANGAPLADLAPDSRYLQYRIELSGTASATPVVLSIGFTSSGHALPLEQS